MPINTKSPEVTESPIITGTYGWTPIEISQILDGGLDFLNRKLAGKRLEQQVQILKKSWYVFEQKSWYWDIKHYIKNDEESWERQSISTVLRDELVSFWWDLFAEEISAAIQINPTILKWFYVKRNGRWYLYDIWEDYRVTGETFLSDVSVQNPEGFDSIDELDISLQNQKFEKELSWKWYQEQLVILQNTGFTLSSRQSSISALKSYTQKSQKGEKCILVDELHKEVFCFNGKYLTENIFMSLDRNKKPLGMTIQRNWRLFYYPLPEQYTSQLVCQPNPKSSDGWFETEKELVNFLKLLYTPVSWMKN